MMAELALQEQVLTNEQNALYVMGLMMVIVMITTWYTEYK